MATTTPMVPSSNPNHGPTHPNHHHGSTTTHCPRCDSTHTKFCYYNNYSLSQPRYFCKSCRRYWTKGGTLRNIPAAGGVCRKNKKISPTSKKPKNDQPTTTTHHRQPPPHSGEVHFSCPESPVEFSRVNHCFMFENLAGGAPAAVGGGWFPAMVGGGGCGVVGETMSYGEYDDECYESVMNGIDVKPRVLAVGWEEELVGCDSDIYGSGQGRNGSSGYELGFGASWVGLMNGYGSSTMKPLI
ncbi:hypothetical protein L6452_33742 [Arctium lappa]|uniref:Uncharacterized protein n=1 Tax=Arctium lappa TaxID=4217 RepID=A0ACB8YGW3_ARCLA|nr:hypothetical protein L6452_33742 [Arctium lappa]